MTIEEAVRQERARIIDLLMDSGPLLFIEQTTRYKDKFDEPDLRSFLGAIDD